VFRCTPKRNRQRNIVWFNPPFSRNVATNIGRKFFALLGKHFPKGSKLHCIFNRNTVKLSYSCLPNVERIVKSHNRKVLSKPKNELKCNCRDKASCPLRGRCQAECIVYKAQVSSANSPTKEYIGLSQPPFKQRYGNHMSSFRGSKYENATELSKHIWELKKSNKPYSITWEIVESAPAYSNVSKKCQLCLAEKFNILMADKAVALNKRSEIVGKCRHQNKYYLSAFSGVT